MADSLMVSGIRIDRQTVDPKTDKIMIAGVVTVVAEYGDTKVSIDVGFSDMASHNDANRHALKQVGNIGHFIEYMAGDLERRSPRSG